MERAKVVTVVLQQINDPNFARDYISYYNGDKSIKLNIEDRELDYIAVVTVERDSYVVAELNFVSTPNIRRHVFPTMYYVKKVGDNITVKEMVSTDGGFIEAPANDVSNELMDAIINAANGAIRAIKKGKNPNNVFYLRK